tara:strand:+ start:162 stop:572 length:411 start_codon:yes stop_codon:yes gene_type:complete
MDWKECKIKRFVKESGGDSGLLESLKKMSDRKLFMDSFSPLNEETVAVKFVVNYDSLREILEALALSRGFKIYNHECFSSFLQEILNLEMESRQFDKFRIIRNSINYYGKDISLEDGRFLIEDILKLRMELLRLIK